MAKKTNPDLILLDDDARDEWFEVCRRLRDDSSA
jgi:DNA-binding response OmpR family regulator